MEQEGYLEPLPPPAQASGSSPLMLIAGVQFSLFPPAGATDNALIFGFSGFSVKCSQVPQGPQS